MKSFFKIGLVMLIAITMIMVLTASVFADPVKKVFTPTVKVLSICFSPLEGGIVAINHIIKAPGLEKLNIGKAVGKGEAQIVIRTYSTAKTVFKDKEWSYDKKSFSEEYPLAKNNTFTNFAGWSTIGGIVGSACGSAGAGTHASNWHAVQWGSYGKVIGAGVGVAITCAEDKWGEEGKLFSSLPRSDPDIKLAKVEQEIPVELL
ncbi:MAG: hypothetical protein WCW02_04920 [Candidatus Buchananbacteria bacterium]